MSLQLYVRRKSPRDIRDSLIALRLQLGGLLGRPVLHSISACLERSEPHAYIKARCPASLLLRHYSVGSNCHEFFIVGIHKRTQITHALVP